MRAVARSIYRHTAYMWRMQRRFPTARFDPSVRWESLGRVELGSDFQVGGRSVLAGAPGSLIEAGAGVWLGMDCEVFAGGTIAIGARTSLQHRTQLLGDVEIGAGCVGAANLYASSGWHEFRARPEWPIRVQDHRQAQRPFAERSRPVRIGDDCWLGINVVVSPGVRIGRGCVVGANSVVTADVAPYTIVAGAPARPIGVRLAFAPPAAIDAGNDADLPYFYAGFDQLGPAASADDAPRRLRKGFVAGPRFVLALDAAAGVDVGITVDADVAGTLVHGGRQESVTPGVQTLHFPAAPDPARELRFEWHPTGSASGNGVVVRAARCAGQR